MKEKTKKYIFKLLGLLIPTMCGYGMFFWYDGFNTTFQLFISLYTTALVTSVWVNNEGFK